MAVTDASGTPAPEHVECGTSVMRVTDREGRFFLPALRIGLWEILADLPGAFTPTRRYIALEVGRSLQVDVTRGLQRMP